MQSKTRLISLRVSDQLRRQLQTAAKRYEISTNQLMRQLLEYGLENNPNHIRFGKAVNHVNRESD